MLIQILEAILNPKKNCFTYVRLPIEKTIRDFNSLVNCQARTASWYFGNVWRSGSDSGYGHSSELMTKEPLLSHLLGVYIYAPLSVS